jgi:hypothetical protein
LLVASAALVGALGCVPPPTASFNRDASGTAGAGGVSGGAGRASGGGGGVTGAAGAVAGTGGGPGTAGTTGFGGDGGHNPDGGDGGSPDGSPWAHHGPGGPNRTFDEPQLFINCAYLEGGPGDVHDHHDIAVMFDGYLLLPWAPEFGKGGMTFYEFADPCAPKLVGVTESDDMRETHTVGFSNRGGVWAVVDSLHDNQTGGVMIWDVADARSPQPVSRVDVPGFRYPDGYAAVVFWAFWQGQYIYLAAGDNGIVIVDAADPRDPKIVKSVFVEPFLRVQQLAVIGNLLFATQSSAARAILMDISDPIDPRPIPGGDFTVTDRSGVPSNMYASNFSGGFGFFTKQQVGGVNIFDLRDPTQPVFVGDYVSTGGAGAYAFLHDPYLFLGDSTFGTLLDISTPGSPVRVGEFRLTGDLDFVTPIGNVAVLSVDEHAEPDRGSAIAPWRRNPDRTPPRVTFSFPRDGDTGVPVTSRVGVTFSEFVDAMSAWRPGAVSLRPEGGGAPVEADVNVQDTILNLSPRAPLAPETRYTFEIPAGGIEDWSGNTVAQAFSMSFETAAP